MKPPSIIALALALVIASGCPKPEKGPTAEPQTTDYAWMKSRVPYDARELLSKKIDQGGLSALKISVKEVSDPFLIGEQIEFKISADVVTQSGSDISTIMLSDLGGSIWYSRQGSLSKSNFTVIESTQNAELINNALFNR